MKIRDGFVSNSSTTSYRPRWPRNPRTPKSPAAPVVKNVVDSDASRKIEILETLLDTMPDGAEKTHVYMVHDSYLDGVKPSDDELKKTRNILYKNRMREEADHFRMASQGMDVMGKSKTKPVAPPKKDKNKIVVEVPAARNETMQKVIQERARGTGGAGPHKNREKDVERGKAPEKHKKDLRDKEASYDGNPDGKPIYPNEIAHGYGEPLAGGTDVMRRLQNSLLYEQGNTDQMRPTSPRVASEDPDYDACVQFLDANMVRMGKKDSAWWLPAHNFGINMTLLGKLNLWVFTILPMFAQKKAYMPAGADPQTEPAGIVTHAIWSPHPKYQQSFPATLKAAEALLTAAKQHSMVGETVQRELKWIEDFFHIDIPTQTKTRLAQEAPKLAARRWSVDRLRVKDKFIPLDGRPAQDLSSWGFHPQYRAAAVRVASRYLQNSIRGGL